MSTADAGTPSLRVVRGSPTPEELAALVLVLFAAPAARPEEQPRAAEPRWGRRGPWRASPAALPGPLGW